MKSYFETGQTKIEHLGSKDLGKSGKLLSPYVPVTTGFTRILLFFKLTGRFPHKIQHVWDEGTLYTHFSSEISKSTIWSYLNGFLTAAYFMLGIIQAGSFGFQLFSPGDMWPDRAEILKGRSTQFGAYAAGIVRSFESIYSLLGVIEYLPVWLHRNKKFTEWLNNWNQIEKEIMSLDKRSTGTGNIFDSKFGNKFALIYTGLLPVVISTLIVSKDLDSSRMFWNLTYGFLCFGTNLLMLSEDVRTILIFKTARDAYKQVRFNVETCGGDSEMDVSKNIDKWNRILIGIRSQVKLGGDCVAFQQLLSIGTLIYFSSASLFICFASFNGETTNSSVVFVLTFTAMNFARIYCKICYASGIADEEKKVVSMAKGIEVEMTFSLYKDELKVMRLHDMLVGSPVEVSLRGYATMNNSLLISIFGQVVTQSIVLMQFQQSGCT